MSVIYLTSQASASIIGNAETSQIAFGVSENNEVVLHDGITLHKFIDSNNITNYIGIIEKTHSELKAMYDNSELNPRQLYKMTDFATVNNILDGNTISGDINTGINEPLILLATSTNTFDKQVYSTLYQQDIIHYDITGGDTRDIAFFDSGVPITGLKGVIYYRKDTVQNVECWYDSRNIKYRRWLVGATAWVASGTYVAKNVYEYNNILYKCKVNHTGVATTPDSDTINWIKWLDKTQNWSWTSDKTQFNIGDITTDNLVMSNPIDVYTFGDYYNWVNDVHIGKIYLDYMIDNYGYNSRLNNIVFNTTDNLYTCYSNTLCDNCFSNTIGDDFYSNTIGNVFISNTIGNIFYSNTIGDNFRYNTIGTYFYSNTIGDDFYSNIIGTYFYSNTIGNIFYSNTIGDDFYSNIIGTYFYSNTIGTGFKYNDFKYCPNTTDFTLATHVYADYNCEIFKNSAGVLRLKYVDDGDIIVHTDITA